MLETLKIGDSVDISDLKSLSRYNCVHPIATLVIDTKKIKVGDISWLLFLIQDEKGDAFFLLEKSVEELSELRLYFSIDEFNGFNQGENREEVLRDGGHFLFRKPENENNFKPSDLIFAYTIDNGEAMFKRKFDPLHGELEEDKEIKICTLVEYKSEDSIENSELLLLEIGGLDSEGNILEEGGAIYLLHGYILNTIDLEIFENVETT